MQGKLTFGTPRLAILLASSSGAAVLLNAAFLSFDAGRDAPEFATDSGLMLSSCDLRQVTQINGISVDEQFFY